MDWQVVQCPKLIFSASTPRLEVGREQFHMWILLWTSAHSVATVKLQSFSTSVFFLPKSHPCLWNRHNAPFLLPEELRSEDSVKSISTQALALSAQPFLWPIISSQCLRSAAGRRHSSATACWRTITSLGLSFPLARQHSEQFGLCVMLPQTCQGILYYGKTIRNFYAHF